MLLLRGRSYVAGMALAALGWLWWRTVFAAVVACGDIDPGFCVAGVVLGDIDVTFVWQAGHLRHWAGSGGALGSFLRAHECYHWDVCGNRFPPSHGPEDAVPDPAGTKGLPSDRYRSFGLHFIGGDSKPDNHRSGLGFLRVRRCGPIRSPVPLGGTGHGRKWNNQLRRVPSWYAEVEQFCQSCRSVAGGQRDEEVFQACDFGVATAKAPPGHRLRRRPIFAISQPVPIWCQFGASRSHGAAMDHGVGWNEGPGFIVDRRGAKLQRLVKDQVEETLLLGAACSEVFSGPRLAKVLRPALEHQRKAIEAMEKDEAWEPLSIHTSAGPKFLDFLANAEMVWTFWADSEESSSEMLDICKWTIRSKQVRI
eukprot:s3960_g7.t1